MKKRISLLLVGLFCLSSIALADSERRINIERLPPMAKSLVFECFNEDEILIVKQEKDDNKCSYEVLLRDGTKMEFNRRGELVEVENEKAGVPFQLIPRKIRNYVLRRFSEDVFILEYERDRKGYEIKLSNDLEIEFDNQFRVREIDD